MSTKLTKFVRCAGCAAKIGLEDLTQITASLKQPHYEDLLVDFTSNDDCGIFKIDNVILLQSVDIITPIADDARTFGQIATANALSDIFAKNGDAKTALSIFMWDKEHIEISEANEILSGALDKLIEANCALVGGHSVSDTEQKFGLSVTGVAKDGIFWKNNSAKVGDSIVLTKPIGSGILSTAMKSDLIEFSDDLDFIKSMKTLNLYAMLEARNFNISAATDVTGFGLIGHLFEMLNQNISINLFSSEIPLFDNVEKFAKDGIIPGGSHSNKKALEKFVENKAKIDDIIFYDAQTSGGLLIALDSKNAQILCERLKNIGLSAKIIAECVEKKERDIFII